MAISVPVIASSKSAVYRPIIFEAASDRNNNNTASVTSVSSGTGSKARYAVASHTFKVNDILTGSGFPVAAYNVRQKVTATAATWIETDVNFSATSTGTLTRTNDNFQMRGDVYVFDQSRIQVTSMLNAGGGQIEVGYSAPHGYSEGDIVMLEDFNSGYNNTFRVKAPVTSTNFHITSGNFGNQAGYSRRGTLIGSKRVDDILVSGSLRFRFNISNLLQSVLTPELLAPNTAVIYTPYNPNPSKWYSLVLTEEYDAVDGTVMSADELPVVYLQAVRAAWQHKETQNLTPYILSNSSTKFLTNAPLTQKIRIGEDYQLSFLANKGQQIRTTVVEYDLQGTPSQLNLPTLYTILDGRGIFQLGTFLNNTLSKIEVHLVDNVGTQVTHKRTFVIDYRCYANPIRVMFENTLGGFDGYTFTGSFKRISGNKKTSYERDLGISFSVKDRGITTLGVDSSEAFEVWSDALTKAEGLWLIDLLRSPNVFVQEGSDWIPIDVLNTDETIYDPDGVPLKIKLKYRYANSPVTLTN